MTLFRLEKEVKSLKERRTKTSDDDLKSSIDLVVTIYGKWISSIIDRFDPHSVDDRLFVIAAWLHPSYKDMTHTDDPPTAISNACKWVREDMIRLGIPFANDRKAEAVDSSEKVRCLDVVLSYIDVTECSCPFLLPSSLL